MSRKKIELQSAMYCQIRFTPQLVTSSYQPRYDGGTAANRLRKALQIKVKLPEMTQI